MRGLAASGGGDREEKGEEEEEEEDEEDIMPLNYIALPPNTRFAGIFMGKQIMINACCCSRRLISDP